MQTATLVLQRELGFGIEIVGEASKVVGGPDIRGVPLVLADSVVTKLAIRLKNDQISAVVYFLGCCNGGEVGFGLSPHIDSL
jgi:hypothetical protein